MNKNPARSRKQRSVRVGVIHNGIQVEDAFSARHDISLIRSVRTLPFVLLHYDVLIVPTHADQAMLFRLKRPLIRYLQLGGVLILLGATTQGRRWMPLFQWEQEFTRSVALDKSTEDGKRVFKGIDTPEYLKYHSKYFGHGSITVSVAQGDQVLARDQAARSVIVVRRLPKGGIIFVTTLDPDYHTSVPVPGPAEEKVEVTHRKAGHLLENIVNWGIWAAQDTPKRFRRRLLGWILPTVSIIGMVMFYMLPVAAFVLLVLPAMTRDIVPLGRIVTAVAFLGSLASIYAFFMNFISKKTE